MTYANLRILGHCLGKYHNSKKIMIFEKKFSLEKPFVTHKIEILYFMED